MCDFFYSELGCLEYAVNTVDTDVSKQTILKYFAIGLLRIFINVIINPHLLQTTA